MAEIRLQKLIAQAGIASRRRAEELISEGRVKVDGKIVTEQGVRADAHRNKIEVDGVRLVPEKPIYIALHKPREVVSTMSDPEGRDTVADLVSRVRARVVPVGRIDYNTSGVLLLTNDGEFANTLLHPSQPTPKVYIAKVHGIVDDSDVGQWSRPIEIDGKATRPAAVRRLRTENGKTWLEITLHEGRNRQIHRLGEATGFPVMKLSRVSFAGITVTGLPMGKWRHLTVDELVALKRAFGVPRSVQAARAPTSNPRLGRVGRRPLAGVGKQGKAGSKKKGARAGTGARKNATEPAGRRQKAPRRGAGRAR